MIDAIVAWIVTLSFGDWIAVAGLVVAIVALARTFSRKRAKLRVESSSLIRDRNIVVAWSLTVINEGNDPARDVRGALFQPLDLPRLADVDWSDIRVVELLGVGTSWTFEIPLQRLALDLNGMPVNPVEYDPDDLVLTISWARSAKPRVRHAISLSPANPLTSEVLPETFPAAWKFWWWGRL